MHLLGKFITEGNDKADESPQEGAMLNGGGMVQVTAIAVSARKS